MIEADPQRGAPPVDVLLAHIGQAMDAARSRQIVHVERLPAREAQYAAPSPPLPEPLQRILGVLGIPQLYTHQVEALERARHGENVVVVTATSSGKTLCYNLPVLETMLADPTAHALYLYPINALVNDQLKGLFKMNLLLGQQAVGIAKYTGAVNSHQRRAIREREPNILLTNPEMLHLSFLQWHSQWQSLWSSLRYVVVDEIHTYRGVFGSNMAHLFRRLLRVAQHYGSTPQFICCSATIANPRELAEALTGAPFAVVDRDGAGHGRRFFVLWNPPLIGDEADNVRRSYAEESVDLLRLCTQAQYNTIVFARSRQLTERMLRLSRGPGGAESGDGPKVSSYRAGYLAEEREEIENQLKLGRLQGIITTNALEMGIDIGGLDAAVISGYPGTVMSTWQQAGRAGRRGRDALVLLVASQNPLDQYYVRHPREFFAQSHERAIVDLENQHIGLKHLLCAARELPYAAEERAALPDEARQTLEELARRELLATVTDDGVTKLAYPKERRNIHMQVSLRSASHVTYRILDEAENEIGTIEPPNVYREAHPGAIYQHGGDDYRVTFLERENHIVRVREETAPHYTRSSSALRVRVEAASTSRVVELGGLPLRAFLGDLLVEETVHSYQELELGSDRMVRRVNLTYPLVMRLHTRGMWLEIPPEIAQGLPARADDVGAEAEAQEAGEETPVGSETLFQGLHAVQHLLTGTMPLLVMCDRRDVDGYYHVAHPDLGAPTVFVYDACQGGIGLAEVAYGHLEALLHLAHATVSDCPCASGCPSCIQSGACRLRNESLDKGVARALLDALVGTSRPPRDLLQALGRREGAAPLRDLALSRELALGELEERTRGRSLLERLPRAEARATPLASAPAERQWAEGDRVKHITYGQGVVLSSRLDGGQELVTVRFARRGMVRELDAAKARLQRLG